MKKHLFRFLVLFLVGLSSLLFTVQTGYAQPGKPGDAPETVCPAPPPAFFLPTSITPTSISLGWGPGVPTPTVYYTLNGYDNTSATALPTVQTTALTYTYSGLAVGHDFTFWICASYCIAGPCGDTISTNCSTGIIIVDEIVGIYECTPNSRPADLDTGTTLTVGIQESSTSLLQGLSNAYTAEFYMNSSELFRFDLAFDGDASAIYKEILNNPANQYTFTSENQGASASCRRNGATVFTVNFVNFNTGSGWVDVTLHFAQAVGAFKFCGNYSGGGPTITGDGGNQPTEAITGGKISERASPEGLDTPTNLHPNPFAQTTLFEYTLRQDSPVEITLIDATGRLVSKIEQTAVKSAGTHQALIDGAGIPDGVYFLRLQTQEQRQIFTLVKKE